MRWLLVTAILSVYYFSFSISTTWNKCKNEPLDKPCWGGCHTAPKVTDQCITYLRTVDQGTDPIRSSCSAMKRKKRGLCLKANWDKWFTLGTGDNAGGCRNTACKTGEHLYDTYCKAVFGDGCPGGFSTEEEGDILCLTGTKDHTGIYTKHKICKATKGFKWNADHFEGLPRVRKSWFDIDDTERERYRDAFKALWLAGELPKFTKSHAYYMQVYHFKPEFFPYHRVLLYQFETKVRELGGKYADFALPYWDHTNDGWRIITENDYKQLGGYNKQGTVNKGCVNDGIFKGRSNSYSGSRFHYKTLRPTSGRQCLIRNAKGYKFNDAEALLNDIINKGATYSDYLCSTGECEAHWQPHDWLGGSGGHMADTRWSPDDPIFYLHHTFVDFLWALWQNCNQLEEVDTSGVFDDKVYKGSKKTLPKDIAKLKPVYRNEPNVRMVAYPGPDIGPDYELIYKPITSTTYKVRDILNLKNSMPEKVQYQKGSFWVNAKVAAQSAKCTDPQGWFVDGIGRRRLEDYQNEINQHGNRRRMVGLKDARMMSSKDSPPVVTDECKKDFNTELAPQYVGKPTELLAAVTLAKCKCRSDACELPESTNTWIEDCLSLELMPNGYGGQDIDVTLDDLKKKAVKPCMKETYEREYDWSIKNDNLLYLCLGCMSHVCEPTAKFTEKCKYAANHQIDIEGHHAKYSPWNLAKDYSWEAIHSDEEDDMDDEYNINYYDGLAVVDDHDVVNNRLMQKRFSNYRYNNRQGRFRKKKRNRRNRLINRK